jgi:DNA replication licensing factor MCM3
MEQQTVTLAKAGIHASLNARCAVLAAANPVYGQYDTDRRPQENVGLPDSLLSRFDLLFIVLDNIDTELDRKLADHILNSHQYRRPGQDMTPEPLNANMYLHSTFDEVLGDNDRSIGHLTELVQTDTSSILNEEETSFIWRIQHKLSAQGSNRCSLLSSEDANFLPPKDAVLHSDFVRKYVNFARHHVEPSLSDEARESIANAYADLRAKADDRTLPVTARCLESLIRIATAHAKVRLSPLVDSRDCHAALKFLSFALYGDVQLEDTKSNLISPTKLRNDFAMNAVSFVTRMTRVRHLLTGRDCQQTPTHQPTR